ncbi:MAG: CRISPR-associated endonuclease Cas1 [Thermofilum sp.]
MRALFVSKPCRVYARKGVVEVRTADGERVEVSPALYDSLVLATRAAQVTSAALSLMAQQGVDLVVLGHRGDPVARLYPCVINKTVATRVAQYRAMLDGRGLEAVKSIVEAKVRNQAAVLRYAAKSRREEWPALEAERIAVIADEVRACKPDAAKLMELEAKAARIYWQAVAKLLPPELGFEGRDPMASDPFNLALNYGYAILYHRCERALLLVGLDPYGGFMHVPRSGSQSLVYDFAEQFRPVAVDKPLIFAGARLEVVNGVLSRESRRAVAQAVLAALSKPHGDGSSKAELDAIILRKAAQLASFLRGSEPVYPAYRVRW